LARKEKWSQERGYGKKPEERTESQQQKCVSASATVGAFLRYICRRDELQKFGYGKDPNEVTEEEQQACVSASSTVDACS
tara:strand:+ start:392 stop:631 length:240 start_codon:yes stop_codon:yes gene_type:complete